MKRIAALDGLRGVLALIVVLDHAAGMLAAGGAGGLAVRMAAPLLNNLGGLAVLVFFAISAHVLTRAWDGHVMVFLVRRLVRLWPVYAACLAAGSVLVHPVSSWSEFVWYPVVSSPADPPGWSLCVEAWAMLFMPAIVWSVTGPRWRLAAGALAWFGLTMLDGRIGIGACFLAGAVLHRRVPRLPWLERAIPQWLGTVSYSLYLSHWLVLSAAVRCWGPWAAIPAIPVAVLTGWVLWRTVEQPSVTLSRRFGRGQKRPESQRQQHDHGSATRAQVIPWG